MSQLLSSLVRRISNALGRQYADPTDARWGCKFNGINDDWPGLQACILWAAPRGIPVVCPEGTGLLSRELGAPDDLKLKGKGKGKTFLKLADTAPGFCNVITNLANVADPATGVRNIGGNTGNRRIEISEMTLDGNFQRLNGVIPDLGGVVAGCCVGFAKVEDSTIRGVHFLSPVKHGIDGCATEDTSANDYSYAPGPSKNVRVIGCEASYFGDDGFTTHYSDDFEFIGCYAHDASGHYTHGNSNGFEIDDGSKRAKLLYCRAVNCSKGLQIKGHASHPAPTQILVIGFTAEGCARNFELRHEGHELFGADRNNPLEPKSTTGYHVELIGCTSISPRMPTMGGSRVPPRALHIAAYDGVLVKGFTAVGADSLSAPADNEEAAEDGISAALIAVDRRATNVLIEGLRVEGVGLTAQGQPVAEYLVKLGGSAGANIVLRDAVFMNCAGVPVVSTAPHEGVVVENVRAYTTVAPAPACIVKFTSSPQTYPYTVRNIDGTGYAAIMLTGTSSPKTWANAVDEVCRSVVRTRTATAQTIMGHDVPLNIGPGGTLGFQTYGFTGAGGHTLGRFDNTVTGVRLQFYKSRAADIGLTAAVQSGDSLGIITFIGDHGASNYAANAGSVAAQIIAYVDGAPSGVNVPGKLDLRTRNAAGTEATRWAVRAEGHFEPAANNVYSIGSASMAVAQVFTATGAVSVSDERAKQDIRGIPDDVLDAWADVEWQQYRFRDAVEQKGTRARLHTGLIAQRVRDAFAARGLDAFDYGVLCFDAWDETPEVPETRDESGNLETAAQPARPAGDRYAVRYEEAFALEAALMRRELLRLKAA